MTTKISTRAALAAASLLLLVAAAAAFAHEGHKRQTEEASSEAPASEASVPRPPTTAETKPHDHSDHAPAPAEAQPSLGKPESNVPKPLAWLGKFHPLLTHFPIALLTAALVAELLFMRSGKALYDHAVRFSVWFGAIGALASATLGWFFAGFHLIDDEWVMTAHRWVGTATALLAAGLLHLCERTNAGTTPRTRFRAALFLGAALVGATGFLGGALIYGLNHYAW